MKFILTVILVLGLAVSQSGAQSLQDFAEKTGARVFWDPYRDVGLFSSSQHWISIDLATGTALGDGETVFDLKSIDPLTGMMGPGDYQKILAWWTGQSPPPTPAPLPGAPGTPTTPASGNPGKGPRIQVIVLDPGHGGTDPGCVGRHTIEGKEFVLQEKDLTLSVVLELRKLLVQTYPDRTVVLTRKDDSYPTLERRVQIADAQKLGDHDSILFLSVHFNASLSSKAKGLEFWYVPHDYEREVIPGADIPESVFPVLNTLVDSEYKKESRELAVCLAKGEGSELGDDNTQRGLKENPWFVVRMARMPAVLAELGFITNPDEAALLRDPEYLKKLAHGLYNGLVNFIQSYEDHP